MTLNIGDYSRLRALAAVQRTKSVNGAARALGVTPSAISQSLRALEETTGLRLFQRIANRLQPTPEATRLSALVDAFEGDVESALAEAHSSKQEPHGVVRIGAASEFGTRILIPRLSELAHYPRLSFRLSFGVPDVLMRALVDQRIDLAFVDDGPFLRRYASLVAFEPVFREELVLVCTKAFEREHVRGQRTFAHLVTLPHVDYVEDLSVVGLWYRHHFGRAPSVLPLKLVTDHVQGVLAAIRAGLGLGLIPQYVMTPDLVKLSMKKRELAHAVVLAQLKDRVPTLAEKRVVEVATAD